MPSSTRQDTSTRSQLYCDDGGHQSLRVLDSHTRNALVSAAERPRPMQTIWMFAAALLAVAIAGWNF